MATLTPSNSFDDVYSLDTSDPVKGGAISGPVDSPTDGQANAQAQALANRTEYLFQRLLPAGVIVPYGGATAPSGWLACNGASVSRTTYSELFSAIGTAYGSSSGTTFNVPDLRGRFLRGTNTFGTASGLDPDASSRTAMATGGNTGDNVGSVQDDAFEAHTHTVNVENGINGAEAGATEDPSGSATPNTFDTGSAGDSTETRPKNAYVNYIIWAGQ